MAMRFNLRKRYIPLQVPPYKRRILATVTVLFFFILISIGSFYVVDIRIRPTLSHLAEAKARQIATRAINEAVRSNISPNIRYQNLIILNFDKEGKVAFMQPNTSEINRISAEAALAVQNRVKDLPQQVIKIPMGQILGLKMLSGMGPELPVRVQPIGIVTSYIEDSFDVAGINQIRHRIFVTVTATVKMVVPFVNRQVRISSKVPLVEAIVMGEVPNIYVGGSGGLIIPASEGKK